MSLNFDALREQIKKGKSVMYNNVNRENNVPYFNLWKQEGWNESAQQYEAFVRLVVKPGTQGFGFRVMHNRVGYPGKDPRSFACPKFLDSKSECVLCDAAALANDPDLKNQFIDWPEKKDGRPIIKPKSVADILAGIGPEQRLIFVVAEPKFLGNESAPKDLRGLQVWFVQKRTLVKKITDIMKNFPPDHFTDPKNGTALMVTFSPKNPPLEMYNVMPYRVMPISDELVNDAPDAETFTSKVRNSQEMMEKLREMLPGVDL
jgi:hypothetical protein